MGLADYSRKTRMGTALVGLSGGVDSAVVACLAAEAFGPDQVLCVALPGPFTAPMSNEDAGDLWFGALDVDGQWKLDEDGLPMYGALASCSGCHAQRESDGFLFGLPRSDDESVERPEPR